MPLKSIAPKRKTKKRSLKFLKKIIDDDQTNLKSDSSSTIVDSEPGLVLEPDESIVKVNDLESESTEKTIESSAAEIVANVIRTVTTGAVIQYGTDEQNSKDNDTSEMVKNDEKSEIVAKAKNVKPKRRSSKKVQIKSQPHVIALENDDDSPGDKISGSHGDSLSGSHGDSSNDHHGDQTPNSPRPEDDNISSSPDGLETMNDLSILYGRKKKKVVRKRTANGRRKPKNTEEVNRAINEKLEQKYDELEDILMQQVIEKRKPIREQHGQQPLSIRKQQGYHGDQYHGHVPLDRRETRKVQPRGLPPRAKLREIAVRDISESEDNSSDRQRVVVSRSGNNIDDGDSQMMDRQHHTESQTNSTAIHRKRTLSADLSKNQRSQSADNPRKPLVPTDNQLGNTENESIQEWLKKKNKQIRQERSKERAKKREEYRQAVLQANDRFEKRMDSQKYYDNWMEKKRKEFQEKSIKDRILLKEYEESTKKKPVPPEVRPRSVRLMVPHSRSSLNASSTFSSIDVDDDSMPKDVRESASSARLHDDEEKQKEKAKEVEESGPSVPRTKFVYKRPVTGKIRLKSARKSMKEADNKRAQSSRSQGEPGVRMSYDQWVTRKRKEDAEKKKRMEKEKELSKSDPELANLLPELAKRRIDRIMNGKKYIDTGLDKINHQVNGAFGGGGNKSGSSDDDKNDSEENNQGKSNNYLWLNDRINWDGKKVEKNVSTIEVTFDSDNGDRPQSAIGFRAPMPKQSRSPRRPESARAAVVNEMEVHVNPYTLPFPPDIGVPKNVAARQRAIFAQEVITKYEEETRPEPQGCDAVIESKCSKQVSFTEPPSTPIPNKSPVSSISSDASDQITKPTEGSENADQGSYSQNIKSVNEDKTFLTTVNLE